MLNGNVRVQNPYRNSQNEIDQEAVTININESQNMFTNKIANASGQSNMRSNNRYNNESVDATVEMS